MGTRKDRWLHLLVLVIAVEVATALVLRGPAVGRVLAGRGQGPDLLATGGLVLIPVLVATLWVTIERSATVTASAEVDLRRVTASRTRTVLSERSLRVALQPIISLEDRAVVGVEALARFPDGSPPQRWFAGAHDAGIGTDLEAYALEAALEVLPQLPADLYLSVNASPALVLDPAFGRLLTRPGLAVDRLVVEITEHSEVDRYDDLRAALKPLRGRGLRLAVDDAGAGYASFKHVLTLRPDTIKLDRSLVTGIDEEAARRAFVTAIVVLAWEIEADVVAEGVERSDELDVLRTLGVDAAQGYLLARPSLERGDLDRWRGGPGQPTDSLSSTR